MSKRSNHELLVDILESIDKIRRYTKGMSFEVFSQDEKTIDAVVRNFEIIGEAANRVEENIKEEYAVVEWRRIIGLRNRIVHEYFGIDLKIIWMIIDENLDAFKSEIEGIIDEIE
ncbi:MAG: DUF86 domain-containing protein [Phaeodactylibacter sp.]|nr:DUF86 domain-containing protein [Phaeodactylibacter sp.]MCB9049718.1 DUF86 domain-containing protein [Lewinellaceae bacterium]